MCVCLCLCVSRLATRWLLSSVWTLRWSYSLNRRSGSQTVPWALDRRVTPPTHRVKACSHKITTTLGNLQIKRKKKTQTNKTALLSSWDLTLFYWSKRNPCGKDFSVDLAQMLPIISWLTGIKMKGKWEVSMKCHFDHFDVYSQNKIIMRA